MLTQGGGSHASACAGRKTLSEGVFPELNSSFDCTGNPCHLLSMAKTGRRPTHGDAAGRKTPEYMAWDSMKARCRNPKHAAYARYGGRGIAIYKEWITSFPSFLAIVGRRPSSLHSLDRYPNKDGNYEPGNVRWATHREQQRNQASNVLLEFRGEIMCKSAWAERFGMRRTLLQKRLDAGWTIEKALTTPSLQKKKPTSAS